MAYTVRSILDPSRVLTYRGSVLGLDAAHHVPVVEDRPQRPVLRLAPAIERSRPSFWRRAAIQAVAHILVHLIDPRPVASLLDQHLQHDAGGKVRGLKGRKHSFIVDGARLQILDLGHVVTLQLKRRRKARRHTPRESGVAS